MRVVAGLVAGGVFPVAMALVGDLVPIHQRQVVIGRLLAVGLTGNVLGAAIAGVIGDLFGWRGIFAVLGLLRPDRQRRRVLRLPQLPGAEAAGRRSTVPAVMANFRGIFADPRAKVCFGSVFFEGIFIHGMFPYVAILLLASGETRASIAGLRDRRVRVRRRDLFAVGPALVGRIRGARLMMIGGALAAPALDPRRAAFPLVRAGRDLRLFGFGFYLLHGCIQVHVTELSHDRARRGRLAALELLLHRPGDRAGGLRLRLSRMAAWS